MLLLLLLHLPLLLLLLLRLLLLLLLCFGGWGEGIAVRGLIRLALILLGGLLAALLCGKVGKRSTKRLVKSHKKLRSV